MSRPTRAALLAENQRLRDEVAVQRVLLQQAAESEQQLRDRLAAVREEAERLVNAAVAAADSVLPREP